MNKPVDTNGEIKPANSNEYINTSIAWVTPFLGRNGKLMYMGPLLGELSKHCKNLTSITAEYSGDLNASPFNITLANRVRRIYWKGKNGHLIGFIYISPRFIRTILKSNADVLFLVEFSLTTIYGLISKIIKRKTKAILVMESKPFSNEGSVLKPVKNFLRKIIVKYCDTILTNNQSGRDFLINQLDADPKKIIAKPYLVSHTNKTIISDNERFLLLDKNSRINFLFVGQLVPRKGIQHLIDAIKLLPENTHERIHIDIVGSGEHKEYLSDYVTQNKLESIFSFHGQVEYSEISKFYSSAHIFIFPTLYDYRALSPFEALNSGLPIISSIYDGGVHENVSDGLNGYICDPLDHHSFSEIVMRILNNPEGLYQFSLKSQEMAKTYTIDNAVTNMLEATHHALSSN